jgi:hypothetical protein
MPILDKLSSTGSSSAVVNGLSNYYVPDNVEQKSDLEARHITAEMSAYTRANWTIDNWGIKRDNVKMAINQFDIRRVSFVRKSRKEMENVLSAEQRREEQTSMDKWLGGMRR